MSSTTSAPFRHVPNPSPVPAARRAEIVADPGFGRHFTDHMVTIQWTADAGWHDAAVVPYGPIQLDPAAMVLHYGQEIFEGLKAYRQPDGSVASFRPDVNAARFRSSAVRLALPQLSEALFLGSLRELVGIDREWVPPTGGEASLYLRPFMFATEVHLGVRPADEVVYMLIASPVGAYFAGGLRPVDVWLCTDFTRASIGGTGAAKCGGNYAASLLPQAQGAEHGCEQVAYLDAAERKWVEEMGGMNLFFVFGSGENVEVVTPELSGSILPGVTRDSLLVLAKELGCEVTERRISADEWLDGVADGRISEVFACGTAAVITPLRTVKHNDGEVRIGDGEPGRVSTRLRAMLTEIQRGLAPDTHHWMRTLVPG